MRIDRLKVKDFKNLKDFKIDIDESQLTSVFIGCNGAGKSNLLEAVVIIFRDLDLNAVTKEFSYEIIYKCFDCTVQIKMMRQKESKSFCR